MNDQVPEFDDVQFQQEQQDFARREGMSAYFDMLLDLLGDKIEPAKRELIKEGFNSIFAGPARTQPAMIMPIMPSPYFTEEHGDCATIWNWASLMQEATHATKYENGAIDIWKGNNPVMTFSPEWPATKAFWQWYTAIANFDRQLSRPEGA